METNLNDIYDLIEHAIDYAFEGKINLKFYDYLRVNKTLLLQAINEIEGLSIQGPEAGFLGWIDCRESELENPSKFFIEEAKVGVYDGAWFGDKNYVRINFGCPRSVLDEAITRIKKAFSQRI